MQAIETEEYKGYTIKIYPDEGGCESPRDWDNLGKMSLYADRWNLPQEGRYHYSPRNYRTGGELVAAIKANEDPAVILPVFMYEHGGVSLKTSEFSAPFDSGCVGVIFARRADVLKEWNVKRISPKLRRNIIKILKGEVEIYGQYLNGEVYGYEILPPAGQELPDGPDSCWGFYGYDYCMQEAKSAVDWYSKKADEEQAELDARLMAIA